MPNILIDSHCHLHDEEWFSPAEAEACLEEAHLAGVEQIIVIGTDPADSLAASRFASSRPGVSWTYGIHPENAGKFRPIDPDLLRARREATGATDAGRAERADLLDANSLVAIGEIGLDYHYSPDARAEQIKLFEEMLALAQSLSLPVSLHIREAFADALPILDNFPGLRGVVHSFTGSKKTLREVLNRGFYVGVNGLATYSTLPLPPLEKMLLETDAPFLTPIPNRGTMNKPGYVRLVAEYLAAHLGVEETIIAEETTKNARQLFNL